MVQASTQNDIVLIADPRVLSIPIVENYDPLIDLINQTAIIFGPSPEIQNNTDYTKMRKIVYEKLIKAQELLPNDLRFCLYEGYRSISLQEKLFSEYYNAMQKKQPLWKHEQIFQETTRLISPVLNLDGSCNVPPHSTGAAIDVYLINIEGKPVDMGILVADWMKDLDGSISVMNSEKISEEAKMNRRIMSNALNTVGFVNYPTEYWHWSYGDRYWAFANKKHNAIYGSVE